VPTNQFPLSPFMLDLRSSRLPELESPTTKAVSVRFVHLRGSTRANTVESGEFALALWLKSS